MKLMALSILGLGLCVATACNATHQQSSARMDPAAEEKWAAPGDRIRVYDPDHPECDATARVDTTGMALLPVVGPMRLVGLTSDEVRSALAKEYGPYFSVLRLNYDPRSLSVEILEPAPRYFVFGEVASEGEREFPGDLTVFEAVKKARPIQGSADLRHVRLERVGPDGVGHSTVAVVDLDAIIQSGDSSSNVHVQAGDIVWVPPLEPAPSPGH